MIVSRQLFTICKSFRKIQLEGHSNKKNSESNSISERQSCFSSRNVSKRKIIFHFFKVILDTSSSLSWSFCSIKMELICGNAKGYSKLRFTTPEFCLPLTFAQTMNCHFSSWGSLLYRATLNLSSVKVPL